MNLSLNMQLVAGLILSIGSLFFIVLLLISLTSKKKVFTVQNRLYWYLLIVVIFLLITEIIASLYLTVDNHSKSLYLTILKIHWSTGLIWPTLLYYYSICFLQGVEEKSLLELIRTNNRFKFAFIFMIVATNIFVLLPMEYNSIDNFTYIPGTSAYFILGYCTIMVILIMAFTFIRCRNVETRKKLSVFIMIFEVVIILGLQFIYQDIAFIGLGATLQMYFLYFNIENPDIQIVTDLETTKNSIERSSNTKLDFLYNMSNEINGPINEIIRYSKLNLNYTEFDEEKIRNNIRYMIKSGNNLIDVINNILDLSIMESEEDILNRRDYSIYTLLKELSEFTKEKIADKPLSFVINVDENTPSVVNGDYSKIYQALANILSNAVKYTTVGKVTLNVNCEYKNDISIIRFKVTDTGEGIKEEDYNKIFEKTTITDENENDSKSSSIGLVITKKHIEMMGGTISFESNYGVGTTFFVSIPQKVINPSPIQNVNELNSRTNNSIEYKDYSNFNVLVVDDDYLNLEITKKLLEKYKINVETVETGNECIYNIKTDKHYDLILMDDMMSEMTGIDVIHALNKLKEIEEYKIPPVVALTATVMTGVEELYLNEGFNDYLAKPINSSSLNKLLNKYFNKN